MENRGHEAHPPAGGRLEWIDVARGIGIVAVVVGHVWTRGGLRDAMYSFHMPLFFLLSGLLSRPQPAGRFTRRQLFSQMRPYAAFLILLILADLGSVPAWPYSRGWGYAPSGGMGTLILVLLII